MTTGDRKSDAQDPAGELDGTTRTADPDGDRTRTTDQPRSEPPPAPQAPAKAPAGEALPSIGLGRRWTAAPWREHALTSVEDLRALTAWLVPRSERPGAKALVDAIDKHLNDAEQAAGGQPERPGRLAKLMSWIGGTPIERAMGNLDAAEVDLLRLAPRESIRGQMPSVLAYVRRQLRVNDPQRVRVEEIARHVRASELTENERSCVVAAVQSANSAARGGEIRGTSTPYSLPVALAVLKLPTGALTAFLGLVLMRGQFVPGLSALDFPAQIVAWAVIFGYGQQLFTRFVDRRAQGVLDDVGGNTFKPETA